MNAVQLWNDHSFRVLLDDLFKARRDEQLGPMRLEVLMRYVGGMIPASAPPVPARTQVRQPEGGIALSGEAEEAPTSGSTLSYLEQQIASRPKAGEILGQAADIVQKAIEAGGWDATGTLRVRLPRNMMLPGLKEALRQRRLSFTDMTFSMPPANGKISDSVKGMSLEAAENASGAQGVQTSGAEIVITR